MAGRKSSIAKHLIILVVATLPLFSLGLSNHGLWSADEPRVAEISREMALTGNWAVPTLNGKPFLEEPPLYYGALALVFKVFGTASDKAVRIPSAFFAFATVLILFFVSNSLYGPRVGLLSALVLATTGEFFRVAHWVLVDSALAFWVMASMGLFITGYLSERDRKKTLCYTLLYVACTLGFYTKGFIGVVIPGLSVLTFLIVERNFKEILRMRLWLGVLIFLLMTLPWFLALWQHGGSEYLKVFFFHNHLQRFLPPSMAGSISEAASGHHHPFYYYIAQFPLGFFPWSILVIPVFWSAFSRSDRTSGSGRSRDKGLLFAKCWLLTGIVFLSIASTKRALYLMPIFAPVAMMTALYIDSTLESAPIAAMGKVFLWFFDAFLLVLGLALIPAFFYAGNAYPSLSLTAPTAFFVPLLVVSAFVCTTSLVGALSLQRRNIGAYWASVSMSIVLVFLFISVAIMPFIDKHKSFVPFCDQVTAIVPSHQPLYAYKPDETLRGVVPFYTGRSIVELQEIPHDLLTRQEPVYLVIRDRKQDLEKELLTTGKLYILAKQAMGSDRTHVLLSNRPIEKTIIIGDSLRKAGKAG